MTGDTGPNPSGHTSYACAHERHELHKRLTDPSTRTESKRSRRRSWRVICSFADLAPTKATRRQLRRSQSLSGRRAAKYITAGISDQSLSRIASWLRKFRSALQVRAWQSGHSVVKPRMMGDNNLALDFLTDVANEKRGRTRPAAAARAINFVRKLIGIPSLAADPRTAMLQEGVLRVNPHAPSGAMPLPAVIVAAVVHRWGSSRTWWKRMVALIMLAAFLSLLRGSGILTVPTRTVTWVVGLEEFMNPQTIPRRHSGALLLVPARKSSQSAPSWIPLRRGSVTQMLAEHVRWRRTTARGNKFLFPSRVKAAARGASAQWRPNLHNRLSQASFIELMRCALVEVCGLTLEQAAKFTAHSLRVCRWHQLLQAEGRVHWHARQDCEPQVPCDLAQIPAPAPCRAAG